MSPKCLISCIAHNPPTSVALSEISPCKMTVIVKSSSALLTSSLTKCPVFVDRIRHFLHLEILHRQKRTALTVHGAIKGEGAFSCGTQLSLTLQLNVNMASALSAGILARCITDPGPGGLLLLLKKGKRAGRANHCGKLMGGGTRGHC